ncbi:hypothetical protein GCM10027064_15240 [Microbacterium petrolearium]
MRHVDTAEGARQIALEILGPRKRPFVLISTIDATGNFAVDPEHVALELGRDAEVATIVSGDVTMALEWTLPEKTHVFGGAARSYPPDFGTAPDWWRSVLRFPDRNSVDQLVEDALAQVTAIAMPAPQERQRWVRCTVELVSGAAGNVGRLESGERVIIASDRPPPGLPLAGGLVVGEPVEGWLLGRDLVPEPADPALDALNDGDVTLARVAKVTDRRANLMLHPAADEVILRRRDVVPGADKGENAEMSVADVVRVGETVRARVVRANNSIGLTLIDVDPTAPVIEPQPLLRGGPAWLREGVHAEVHGPNVEPPFTPTFPDRAPEPQSAPVSAAPVGIVPSRELQEVRDEVAALRGAIGRLSHELRTGTDLEALDRLRDEVTSLSAELHRERERRGERDSIISRLNQELREARAGRPTGDAGTRRTRRDQWASAEHWVRHEVASGWAARTTAGEKREYLLPEFEVGPRFAQSLEMLDEAQFGKAMRTTVDVLLGRAPALGSRDLHRLRSGAGGNDPYVERADGAKCWRASIKSNVPSARRLHYWQLPGGRIELSRVVLHDDFAP